MPGGTLTITADAERQLFAILQRVLCDVAPADRGKVRTTHGANGRLAVVVPEEIFAGALALKNGGANILAGYVAGSHVAYHAGNGASVWVAPTTPVSAVCPGDTDRIQLNAVAVNVGANPRAITIDYANGTGLGTVNVYWGDGTSTLGAAEANAALAHTYTDVGTYKIRIEDASVAVDATAVEFWVRLPLAT